MTPRRITIALLLAILALVAILFAVGPRVAERSANYVVDSIPPTPDAGTRRLYDSLFVADLHADSLLWNRDLLERGTGGHVDVPRLVEGGVALQVFGVVTKVPFGQNYESNPADAADVATALALLERWPPRTWGSLKARALYQAERLRGFAARSRGRFRIIETAGDLRRFAADRRVDPGLTAGLLAIEGAHAIEGDLDGLDDLFAAGFRMVGLAHFFDNELAGSRHGVAKGGLTDLGRAAVRRLEERGMVVDLAHTSARTFEEVLAMATRPVVVSHTGVRATCDHGRNLGDDQLRAVAAGGGLVGIGYWDAAVCDVSVAGIARAILHTAAVAGVDHVALGSDFDGATGTPFDTTGIPLLAQELRAAGMPDEDLRRVMGENVRRLLERLLP